ncbi:peptide deformylase [Roseicyclus sp. F158]|uniref:Peptide deformylase n=1 Tax=Tropicimonas omnivorans TaxID=3075590 RepID=A0ABU3DE53_9RHOB|nr:peptide deformylase [Roseicyclus sp. F158]MDT0681417.1 peptide deformylase [Roseicyclus sp. F158]
MILPILNHPDPRLAKAAPESGGVTSDLQILAADLLETMYAAPGRGLAATQVGREARMFVMDTSDWQDGGRRQPYVCIDPEITEQGSETASEDEGCLSIPGINASVERPETVTLAWTDLSGNRQTEELSGAKARVAQHEIDHLDGKLILDRIDPAERERLEAASAE